MKILIKAGACVKRGVLSTAVLKNRKTIAELWIKSGADVNDGTLGTAVQAGLKGYVDLLLLSGAEVNNDDSSCPPLIIETRCFRYKGCVEALIAAGADVNSSGCDGITNLMYAAERGDQEMVKTLIKAGADVDECYMTPLIRAVNGKDEICVQLLIEAGADLNYFDEDGDYCALPELVKLLIRAGADVSIPLANGQITTLHDARLLLKEAAGVNRLCNNVDTLKGYIVKRHPQVNRDVCMLLLAAGAIIQGTTLEGKDMRAIIGRFLFRSICCFKCIKN